MKKTFKQKILGAFIGLSMLGFAGSAFAGASTAYLTTTVNISGSCGFVSSVSPPPVTVAALVVTSTVLNGSSNLTYNCSSGYTPVLTATDLLSQSMSTGTNTFNINVYSDSAMTTDIGATGYAGLALTANGTQQTQTVYLAFTPSPSWASTSSSSLTHNITFTITY